MEHKGNFNLYFQPPIPLVTKIADTPSKETANYGLSSTQVIKFEAKTIFKPNEMICQGCKINCDKLLKLPNCSNHEFCENCIKNRPIHNSCEKCAFFFSLSTEKSNSASNLCLFCQKKASILTPNCESHVYCESCYDFMSKNSFSHLVQVSDCKVCSLFFVNLRPKVEQRVFSRVPMNLNSYEITESNMKNKQYVPHLSSDKNLNNFGFGQITSAKSSNYESKQLPRPISNDPNNRFGPKSKDLIIRCCTCFIKLNKPLKTPRCTTHTYCDACINKVASSIKCDYCNMYFECFSKNQDVSILKCTLCKLFPMKSDINCKLHSYCIYCYGFLTQNEYSHIIIVVKCEECTRSLKKIKNSILDQISEIGIKKKMQSPIVSRNKTTRAILNPPLPSFTPSGDLTLINPTTINQKNQQLLNLKPDQLIFPKEVKKCSMCMGERNAKKFICNHNLCSVCLVKMCCSQIKKFMIEYPQCNRERVYKFSHFYCTYCSCNKPISVPTKMLKIYLVMFLNDPVSNPDFVEYSDLLNTFYLDVWFSYYDGLA